MIADTGTGKGGTINTGTAKAGTTKGGATKCGTVKDGTVEVGKKMPVSIDHVTVVFAPWAENYCHVANAASQRAVPWELITIQDVIGRWTRSVLRQLSVDICGLETRSKERQLESQKCGPKTNDVSGRSLS